MFSKGCNRGTIYYVERQRVSEGRGIIIIIIVGFI